MTDLQQLFADEFLLDLNGAAAARRAGYDKDCAKQMSYKNLSIPEIRDYIRARMTERSKETFVDSTFVVESLKEVHARCMQATPVMVYDAEKGDYVHKQDDMGNHIWTFDAAGANKALDLLGKHSGTFEKDNSQKAALTITMSKEEVKDISNALENSI